MEAIGEEGYVVSGRPDVKHLAKRKNANSCWLGVDPVDSHYMADLICEACGVTDYLGMYMAEPFVRTLPALYHHSDTVKTDKLFSTWYPVLLEHLRPYLEISPLHIERGSKMGAPYYENRLDKTDILRQKLFPMFLADDYSAVEGAHTIVNVRRQQERRKKIREGNAITEQGRIYPVEFNETTRAMSLKGVPGYSCRGRLVFNPPTLNAYKQSVDNMYNGALMKGKACHNDMYEYHDRGFKMMKHFIAGDVKHFDRHVGSIVQARAEMIGAGYAKIQRMINECPVAVMDDTWMSGHLVAPDTKKGYGFQLASGDSCVAPIAKELFLCVYASFIFEQKLASSPAEAMRFAFDGGPPGSFKLMNFGDDNFYHGDDAGLLNALFDYQATFMTMEREDPPAFLSWVWDGRGWKMKIKSRFKNLFYPEQSPGTAGRPYFWGGFSLGNITYRRYGEDGMNEAIDKMLHILDVVFNITQDEIEAGTELDFRNMARGVPINYITGKDYLLTPEEKMRMGTVEQIPLNEILPIVHKLVDPHWIGLT